MDRIYKVVLSTYVVQKDYMDEPDTWDWSNLLLRINDFQTTPEIKITELTEGGHIDLHE